jgi:hypothetical protein
MDVNCPYEFIGSGAMDHNCPYEFIASGALDCIILNVNGWSHGCQGLVRTRAGST